MLNHNLVHVPFSLLGIHKVGIKSYNSLWGITDNQNKKANNSFSSNEKKNIKCK